MVKTSRRKALALFLGAVLSSAVSGCVTGYVEGTEDYIKFCVERKPSPSPTRCPKKDPAVGMDLSIPRQVILAGLPSRAG